MWLYIYQCLYEYKIIIYKGSAASLNLAYYSKAIDLIQDQEYMHMYLYHDDTFDQNVYYKGYEEAKNKCNETDEELFKVRKELLKHIGQYRFFIGSTERKKFDEILKPLNKITFLKYDFSEEKAFDTLDEKIKECKRKLESDLSTKYKGHINQIEDFVAIN